MADPILHKRSSVAGVTPAPTALTPGELALNTADGVLFTKTESGEVATFRKARTVIAATTSFYVASTGSDSNDGSSAAPWLTMQHAIDTICATYEIAKGVTIDIRVAAGTYVGPISFTAGNGQTTDFTIRIWGVSGDKTAVRFVGPVTAVGANFIIIDCTVEITGTGSATALRATTRGSIRFNNGKLISTGDSQFKILAGADSNSVIQFATALDLEFSQVGSVFFAADGSSVGSSTAFSSLPVTISGSPSVLGQFALAASGGSVDLTGLTFSGSPVTGKRFTAQGTGQVFPMGAGIPGTVAGTSSFTVREQLTADRTYFVRTDGSDSNNGLTNTAGGAFLTIQKAIDVAASLDLGIFSCTIQVAAGTYTGAVVLKAFVGAGQVRIIGNEAAPASVIISGGGTLVSGTDCGRYLIAGVTLASTGLRNIQISGRSQLQYRNIVSQGAAGLNTHIAAINGAEVQSLGNITLNGNSAIGFLAAAFGLMNIRSQPITFAAGTTIPARAFQASDQGRVDMLSVTFSGSFTGKRYEATGLGAIFTNNAGETYIPGTIAGTTATGGIYY